MVNRVSHCRIAVALALLVAWVDARECAAQYGPPSWAGSTLRGRYHYYNGPSVSFGRGRWGGGISNNGALVLNNLVSTAGAVAPVILPMLMPGAGAGAAVASAMLPPGTSTESASAEAESAVDIEPVDPNRDDRNKKLVDVEARTLGILKRLKMEEPASLSSTNPAAQPAQDGTVAGPDPTGKPLTTGKKPKS
jgi:hypothetical protein